MKLLKHRTLIKRENRMNKARMKARVFMRRQKFWDASNRGQERRLARRFFLAMNQMYTYRGHMSAAWLKSMEKNGGKSRALRP